MKNIQIHISHEFIAQCPDFLGVAIQAIVKNSETAVLLWNEITSVCEVIEKKHSTESLKEVSGIAATRMAYKKLGKDPSRYRPACEQLVRRVVQKKGIRTVGTLGDISNLVSLKYGYSTAAIDVEKLVGNSLTLGIGRKEEPYEGIGRGVLNIEHLPVYRDALGGVATPTSDNIRTQTDQQTSQLLFIINAYDGNRHTLECSTNETLRLLTDYAEASDVCITYFQSHQ